MNKVFKIVICGAGFGGLYTFLNLREELKKRKIKAEITIINKNNYFLFTPLLHEVATGSVNQTNIVQPIKQILSHCQFNFFDKEVVGVKVNTNEVVLKDDQRLFYDFLVLALGSKAKQVEPMKNEGFILKDLNDAKKIKNHIINCFEQAENLNEESEKAKLLTFVIVGGGPTGVELAAEISEFAGQTLQKVFPRINKKHIKIILVHSGKKILQGFKERLSEKSLHALKTKEFVEIKLNTRFNFFESQKAYLENNEVIYTNTVIYTLGVVANTVKFDIEVEKNQKDQIRVNQFLEVFGKQNIFALGDMAWVVDGQNKIYPETAQVAEAQSKFVAENIIRKILKKDLKVFEFKERGQLVSLGQWMAVAEIKNFYFFGHFAWWVWRTIYASKLIGWKNRIRVVIDWTLDIFYPRDISKL